MGSPAMSYSDLPAGATILADPGAVADPTSAPAYSDLPAGATIVTQPSESTTSAPQTWHDLSWGQLGSAIGKGLIQGLPTSPTDAINNVYGAVDKASQGAAEAMTLGAIPQSAMDQDTTAAQWSQQNPGLSNLALNAGRSIPAMAAASMGNLGPILGGGLVGGSTAQVAGTANREIPTQVALDTAIGTGGGMAAGGLARAVAGIPGAVGSLYRGINPVNPTVQQAEDIANQKLGKAMADYMQGSGKTVADITQGAAAKTAQGVDASFATEGGLPVQRLVKAAAISNPAAGQSIEDYASGQNLDQSDRVSAALKSMVNPASGDYNGAVATMMTMRSDAAKPAFNAVRAQPPVNVDSDLAMVLQTPAGQKAMNTASTISQNNGGGPLPNLFDKDGDFLPGAQLSWNDIHNIKMGLDDAVGTAQQEGLGAAAQMSQKNVRSQFLDSVSALPGGVAYRGALDQYAGDSAMLNALQDGKDVFTRTPADSSDLIADYTPAEQHMYRVGVGGAIEQKAADVGDGRNVVNTVFGSKGLRARVATAFSDPADYQNFADYMNNEKSNFAAMQAVRPTSGSSTAGNLIAQGDLADQQGVGGALKMAAKNAGPSLLMGEGKSAAWLAAKSLYQSGLARAQIPSPLTAQAIGRIGLQQQLTPGSLAAALSAHAATPGNALVNSQLAKTLINLGIGQGAGAYATPQQQ